MKISLILTVTVAWVSYAEGEPTYPDAVTVSSTGAAAENQVWSMGVYKKTTQTWSGRPVWRHTGRDDRFLFYDGDATRWVIHNEVTNGRAHIQSKNSALIDIPQTGWQYSDSGWHDDNTLTVTKYYPITVTVSSTGAGAEKQTQCMGVYKKTTQTWSGRPVWKHQYADIFLFKDGDSSRWVIHKGVSNGVANIMSKKSALRDIPKTGWQYSDSGWHDDNTLSVTEGEPTYPDTVTVSSTGAAADKHPQCMGVYKKTTQTWSGRPVWRHTGRDDRSLFYNGDVSRWYISNKVYNGGGFIKATNRGLIDIPLTGWQYGDRRTWHDDNTLSVIDVAGNLLEQERTIIIKYSLQKTIGKLLGNERKLVNEQFDDDYFPAYNRAKSSLRETRRYLRKLANRTVTDVRDFKIVLGHLKETNSSLSFKIFGDKMKDLLKIESLEQARHKYESAVKTFEDTNSFILTRLFYFGEVGFSASGQDFDAAINVVNSILNDEIDLISIWTQMAKAVRRNIDNYSKEILVELNSIRKIFINGLDDLESAADQFQAQLEVIIIG